MPEMSSSNISYPPSKHAISLESPDNSKKGEHSLSNSPDSVAVAPGVTLSDIQKQHVAVVLDLFQAKGTEEKMTAYFTEDAFYEDLFATANGRTEIAGQLLGLPVVTKSAETISSLVTVCRPLSDPQAIEQLTGGKADRQVEPASLASSAVAIHVNEIELDFEHRFAFKPTGSVKMHTTLIIWSDEKERKIRKLQDRPMEKIPENSLLFALRKFNAAVTPHALGLDSKES